MLLKTRLTVASTPIKNKTLRKKRNNARGPKCSHFAPEIDRGQSRGDRSVDDRVRLSEAAC